MSFEIWIAFMLASAALLAIPGPTVMLVISYAMGYGKRTGWATVPGVTLGDFLAMSASLLGAGAILATSATLFTILKLAGAIYLIWLGVQMLRTGSGTLKTDSNPKSQSMVSMFLNATLVTALNPKSIMFFVAFVPQFTNPTAPLFPQFAIMEITFLTLAAVNVALWAIFAGNLRERFANSNTLNLMNRAGGVILVGAGLMSAVVRKQ